MMQYPRYVYKIGGPHEWDGIHHERMIVEDDVDHQAALHHGWFDDLKPKPGEPSHDEIPPKDHPRSVAQEDPGDEAHDDTPPTREELEIKAKELGLKYHHKTGDKKLAEMIQQALEA